MIRILNHSYEHGLDAVIDYLDDNTYIADQEEIAAHFGKSVRTIETWIAQAKRAGWLKIYRYENNNFIYCIGSDVENMYDANVAIETLKYRDMSPEKIEVFDEMPTDDQEEYLYGVNPFIDKEKEAKEMEEWRELVGFNPPEPKKVKGLNAVQKMEAHRAIDKLGY